MSRPQKSPPALSSPIAEIFAQVLARHEARIRAATLAALAQHDAQTMARSYQRHMRRLGLAHIQSINFEN